MSDGTKRIYGTVEKLFPNLSHMCDKLNWSALSFHIED